MGTHSATAARVPSRPGTAASATATAWIVGVVFAVHLGIALVVRTHGWDDGSITLAFARTFADHGRIALTEHSEQVEGFSSLAWFGWLTLVDLVIPLGFTGFVLASQISAAVAAAITAAVLYRVLLEVAPHRRTVAVIAACTLVFGLFLNETANGMEMTLLTAVAVVMVRALQTRRSATLYLGATLVAFIRLEATGYVVIGALTLWALNRGAAVTAAKLAAAAVAGAAVTTAVRVLVFGALVPNTITAKKSPPYTPADLGAQISGRQFVVVEFIAVFAPALVLLVFSLVVTGRSRVRDGLRIDRTDGAAAAFAVGYVVGVVLVNIGLGRNLGYFGRMELSAAPLAVFLVVRAAPDAWITLRGNVRTVVVVVVTLVLSLLTIDTSWVRAVADPDARPSVTPERYRDAGQAFDDFGKAAGLRVVSVFTPDVGGSSLCCRDLRILDLALLANAELADRGYGYTGAYLEKTRPDLIETHAPWTDASRILDSAVFRDQYRPVSVNGFAFYARDDLVEKVADRCDMRPASQTRSDVNRGATIDEDHLGNRPVCVLTATPRQ
ncbi:MAG: hypothetical protein NTW76_09830 [Corynebacteriales bacterium]|nr:hypothetical protein [Mycobacteriales bacterium]